MTAEAYWKMTEIGQTLAHYILIRNLCRDHNLDAVCLGKAQERIEELMLQHEAAKAEYKATALERLKFIFKGER